MTVMNEGLVIKELHQNEDIKLMLVNGYPAPTPTATPREVITLTPKILKMKVLPV